MARYPKGEGRTPAASLRAVVMTTAVCSTSRPLTLRRAGERQAGEGLRRVRAGQQGCASSDGWTDLVDEVMALDLDGVVGGEVCGLQNAKIHDKDWVVVVSRKKSIASWKVEG